MKPSAGGEASLLAAINAARAKAGKPALRTTSILTSLAQKEASRIETVGQASSLNLTDLRQRSGGSQIGAMVGRLKDRGPQTGGQFPEYWMKSPTEAGNLLGDWYSAGVATVRSANGDMVAVVLLGR